MSNSANDMFPPPIFALWHKVVLLLSVVACAGMMLWVAVYGLPADSPLHRLLYSQRPYYYEYEESGPAIPDFWFHLEHLGLSQGNCPYDWFQFPGVTIGDDCDLSDPVTWTFSNGATITKHGILRLPNGQHFCSVQLDSNPRERLNRVAKRAKTLIRRVEGDLSPFVTTRPPVDWPERDIETPWVSPDGYLFPAERPILHLSTPPARQKIIGPPPMMRSPRS